MHNGILKIQNGSLTVQGGIGQTNPMDGTGRAGTATMTNGNTIIPTGNGRIGTIGQLGTGSLGGQLGGRTGLSGGPSPKPSAAGRPHGARDLQKRLVWFFAPCVEVEAAEVVVAHDVTRAMNVAVRCDDGEAEVVEVGEGDGLWC